MDLREAKEILNKNGYSIINEREVNLNNLVKDIFELLTSYDVEASDDEVEKLVWNYINSGYDAEHASAEDVIEFDIDNAPDTIIDYTHDFVDWIKSGQYKTESVDASKQILENAGYIVEDTDDWDEADMPIGTPKQRVDRVKKHEYFRDLDHKTTDASNFNIKNLFYGVEKELKKVYKKVEIEASDYDDENKSQLVRYYYKFNKKTYNLEVLYRDEDDVINVQLFADDWYGHERDDFSVTTIDDAIKQIIKFAHYNTV